MSHSLFLFVLVCDVRFLLNHGAGTKHKWLPNLSNGSGMKSICHMTRTLSVTYSITVQSCWHAEVVAEHIGVEFGRRGEGRWSSLIDKTGRLRNEPMIHLDDI